jgi:CBS domain-containing protein
MPVVANHMTRNVLTVEPGLPLVDAARRMNERAVGAVVVVEGGRLVGILSRTVLQRRLAEDEPPAQQQV